MFQVLCTFHSVLLCKRLELGSEYFGKLPSQKKLQLKKIAQETEQDKRKSSILAKQDGLIINQEKLTFWIHLFYTFYPPVPVTETYIPLMLYKHNLKANGKDYSV